MASNASPHETFEALLESLQAGFPALQHYLPLVLNTRQRLPNIAAEFNVPKDQIARALKTITHDPAYQEALAAPESMRHTLEGIPVKLVSDKHRAFAQAQLDGIPEKDMPRVEKHRTPGPAAIPKIPLTPELLTEILTMAIPGKLDVTLKINELPRFPANWT